MLLIVVASILSIACGYLKSPVTFRNSIVYDMKLRVADPTYQTETKVDTATKGSASSPTSSKPAPGTKFFWILYMSIIR